MIVLFTGIQRFPQQRPLSSYYWNALPSKDPTPWVRTLLPSPLLHFNPTSLPPEPGETCPFLKHAITAPACSDLWHQSPALSWNVGVTLYYFSFCTIYSTTQDTGRQDKNLNFVVFLTPYIQHAFKHFQIE